MSKTCGKVLSVRVERIAHATPDAIDFLWSNWEVFGQLAGGYFGIRRLAGDQSKPENCGRWAARRFAIYGEWELVSRRCNGESGEFIYYCSWRKWGLSFRSRLRSSYKALTSTATQFETNVVLILPRVLRLLCWALEGTCFQAMAVGADLGKEAAERVTEEYNTGKYSQILLPLRDILADYMRGKMHTEHAPAPVGIAADTSVLPEEQAIRARLAYFERAYPHEARQVSEAVELFRKFPEMALILNRKIVERVLKQIFQKHSHQPAGKRMCGELISKLRKDNPELPPHILSLMETVTNLGNAAVHDQGEHSSSNEIGLTEFAVSFGAMIKILEWYLESQRGASADEPMVGDTTSSPANTG